MAATERKQTKAPRDTGRDPSAKELAEANRSAALPKVLRVKVKPSSHVSRLEESSPGVWLARVMAPPVDGKANEELVTLIAKHFGCARSAVSIKSGVSARMKLIRIKA